MQDGQEIELSEPASAQHKGLIFLWKYYNAGLQDHSHNYYFVPKANLNGAGVCMSGFFGDYYVKKYVYISDKTIKGNVNNNQTLNISGITCTNNRAVLTDIFGV